MGSDCEPISRFRRTTGRAYFHAVDARKEVAWFVANERIESENLVGRRLTRNRLPGSHGRRSVRIYQPGVS